MDALRPPYTDRVAPLRSSRRYRAAPGGCERARPRLPARLSWRVYLNGLILLVLVVLALVGVVAVIGRGPSGRNAGRLADYAAVRAAALRAHPARLERELRGTREAFGAEVTVYQRGAVFASNVVPPLAPLAADARPRLAGGSFEVPGRRRTFAAPVEGAPDTYLLLTGNLPAPSILRGASLLSAVLLALALVSIPLARRLRAAGAAGPRGVDGRPG